MKKTVVEWYFTQLWRAPKDKFMWHRILIKAKEMEKERMIEFAWECQEMFKHEIKEHFEEKFNDGGNK
jgi:hypothetical protein